MRSAIFLDRDGTIIKDKGYIKNINQIELYPFTIKSLKKLQKEFLLFIVTNQSGISKGLMSQQEVDAMHSHLKKLFRKNGVSIQKIYSCPHDKNDGCKCRKPKKYFIDQAVKKYNLDISSSFVIGDHPSDIELAINVGAHGIFVLTGHGKSHKDEIIKFNNHKVFVCKSLYYATIIISTNTLNKNI
jgi:D-glycero-D-manno-heptose 1,7-bisphosphate phosphatase